MPGGGLPQHHQLLDQAWHPRAGDASQQVGYTQFLTVPIVRNT